MAMYAATQSAKRQKTTREVRSTQYDSNEYFPGIGRVEYRPDAGAEESLCYRHYNSAERVHGRTMEEWIKPAVSFWHAFHYRGCDSHGAATFTRNWETSQQQQQHDTTNSEIHKKRLRAAFEMFAKLGVRYWTVYDRDLAPEGDSLEETHNLLDEGTELVMELQQRTGVKPLWLGCNLFQSPRYMSGAATSPDCQVVASAAAQLKKAMEVAHKLGAEAFLVWGAREAYRNPLTADLQRDIRRYATFLKMAVDYKEKLGYRGQLLLRPGPPRDCRDGSGRLVEGRYDYDAMSALCMLKHHGLDKHFKLSVTPGRDHLFAAALGALGSVNVISDYKYIEPLVMEPFGPDITLLCKTIIDQGVMSPGGICLEIQAHRECPDLRDLAVTYTQAVDSMARSLRSAVRVVGDGHFTRHLQQQRANLQTGIGQRLASGEATLEECEEFIRRHGEPAPASARLEHWAAVFRYYN